MAVSVPAFFGPYVGVDALSADKLLTAALGTAAHRKANIQTTDFTETSYTPNTR